jgi:putative sterol carrier protein
MSDLNAQKIFGEILPEKLEGNDKARSADAVYVFDIDGDNGGTWTVDLTTDSDFVTEGGSDDADCTISMKEDDFVKLWEGKLPGAQAFMMGKLKIQGDMGLAMKLQNFLG